MKKKSTRNLRRRNDFLKKKLENIPGSVINISSDLDENILNQFLENVASYEEAHKEADIINVIDKTGDPGWLKKAGEIRETDMEEEWQKLYNYMYEHGVDLQVISPNVCSRELYRFTTEELFYEKIAALNIPGMMTCFIYDEFYPDHAYDNEQFVVQDCINHFFDKCELFDFNYSNRITVNKHNDLQWDEFVKLINAHRKYFEKVEGVNIQVSSSFLQENEATVNGKYEGIFFMNHQTIYKSGKWNVTLCYSEFGYYFIRKIEIEGVLE